MKIISWNIRNVGEDKLISAFTPVFASNGLGGNVLDFITKFVVNSEISWDIPGLSRNPADIFVVVELACGGDSPNQEVSGSAETTLTNLKDAMNQAKASNPYGDQYHYNTFTPVTTGKMETVGFIYNERRLNFLDFQLYKHTETDTYLPDRTPIGARFRDMVKDEIVTVVGIHASPEKREKGKSALYNRPPIDYCRLLGETPVTQIANTFIGGDFNCSPDSFYLAGGEGNQVRVYPFGWLQNAGFQTLIPNGTLSSVRLKINAAYYPNPPSYLRNPFDNLFYNANLHLLDTTEMVADLIGFAENLKGERIWGDKAPYSKSRMLLSAFNQVSDHMPVVIEY